jgi:AraC-like DNA-binding protein
MSRAVSIYHGRFGRATLYRLNRPMATHAHREGHLIFLVQGTSSLVPVLDRPRELSPEAAVAVNPWEPHSFVPGDQEDGSLYLVLYVKPIWFLEFGRSAQSALRFGRNEVEMTSHIGRAVNKVTSLLLEDAPPGIFDGYLYELTHECFDQTWQWMPQGCHLQVPTPYCRDFRVRKSMKLMSQQLGSEVVLDDIARYAGLSRPHFYRLFRDQTGLTPNLFLNTLRMERAIEALTETSDSVADIGFNLGFASQSSFSRFFATNVGMAPSDYRRVAYLVHP